MEHTWAHTLTRKLTYLLTCLLAHLLTYSSSQQGLHIKSKVIQGTLVASKAGAMGPHMIFGPDGNLNVKLALGAEHIQITWLKICTTA